LTRKICPSRRRQWLVWFPSGGDLPFRVVPLFESVFVGVGPAPVDLMTVKEPLGHKSNQMTLLCAHLAPDHKWAAIDRLDPSRDISEEERRAVSILDY
jgi:hypothetical protein